MISGCTVVTNHAEKIIGINIDTIKQNIVDVYQIGLYTAGCRTFQS